MKEHSVTETLTTETQTETGSTVDETEGVGPVLIIGDGKAAEALGISPSKFGRLKKKAGFPKPTPDGWDIEAVAAFIAEIEAASEDGDSEEDSSDPQQQSQTTPAAVEPVEPDAVPFEVRYVQIAVPVAVTCKNGKTISGAQRGIALGKFSPGIFRGHVSCKVTDSRQLDGFRAAHQGVRESHVTFAGGGHVDSQAALIKYLCELIGIQIEAAEFVNPETGETVDGPV